jgi:ATP-dependent Lon protease
MIATDKINKHFPGLVVRKDLSKLVKGNALVPTYVLEYLLGQYCATDDEQSIKSGIETVKEILRQHYVNRTEAELAKSTIKERGRYKVIDRVTVSLNDKSGAYEAVFSNLGVKRVVVDSEYVKAHPKLLVGGVWCIVDLQYIFEDDPGHVPWVIETLKPIQISNVDFDGYMAARAEFTTDEWIDFIIQGLGLNPDELGERNKLFQLVRLISYCENNYNLIELGPKGTGKSHVFSEFSPHGILVSGGEITLAKLFVNNSTGKLGLVGYWDVVAFDEFAGIKKSGDKTLVDVMKNYMANRSFSRGTEQLTADASVAFVGNTSRSVSYMLKHSHLFADLPDNYQDSAFLDRVHFYIPGWEVNIIRNEMFTDGFGFIVDYLAQVFKHQRFQDYTDITRKYFDLDPSLSTRDKEGIYKTASGLLKIIFPHRDVTKADVEWILRFAMEGRKRVKTEIMKMDRTFDPVEFRYTDLETGETKSVETAEEMRYPHFFRSAEPNEFESEQTGEVQNGIKAAGETRPEPTGPRHFTVVENQTGISYMKLFGDYLRGARHIEVVDPYVRKMFQIHNFVEFLQVVLAIKEEGEDVEVHLVTSNGDISLVELEQHLEELQDRLLNADINFSYEIDSGRTMHARSITTDTGWKISLDRGLDIFQRFDGGLLSIQASSQETRFCKAFEVTYIKVDESNGEKGKKLSNK